MTINLKDRNSSILKALIKEYTRTGEPVASEILNVKYRLGVSSATIRNDFTILAEEGYLYKPCLLYTSPSPRDLSTSRMPSSA